MPSAASWSGHKPNQQLIALLRTAEARGAAAAAARRRRVTLGAQVRQAFAGLPLPLLAVQTHFSLLEGTVPPAAWAVVLETVWGHGRGPGGDRRGGNHPSDAGAVVRASRALERARAAGPMPPSPPPAAPPPEPAPAPWAVLADRDDWYGLPAVLEAWGRERVGIGGTLSLDGEDVLLLAPGAVAYRALSHLWSRRHDGCPDRDLLAGRCLDEVVVLVTSAGLGRRCAAAGAEVWWRAGLRPETGSVPFPVAAAPLLAHLDEDRAVAPVLAAIRGRGTIDRRHPGGAAVADLLALPARYRGYEAQLAAGAALQARCRWLPGGTAADGQPVIHLPPLPPELHACDADRELRQLAEAGIPARYGADAPPAVRTRLEHELGVIRDKRFASYILTVWSIARRRRTCGRGSAASSVVVYLLGITNVDPLRYNLLFERFLAPERSDPPDIDIDFPWDERDDVFADTVQRFGVERVAMVATHLHLHTEGAIREAARAHGLPDGQISPMQARLGELAQYGVDRDGDADPGLPDPWASVLATAQTLIGAPRHVGLHCGGVVITTGPIRDVVPVHPAAKRIPDRAGGPGATRPIPAIAWEKDGAEILGLVKIDLLGNRSLAVVRDCLNDLAEDGVAIDEGSWHPAEDKATRQLIAEGRTFGCFYMESPAMRALQAKVGSGDFDRLVVHSSIIRPAGSPFIGTYLKRHHRWIACQGAITAEERAEWYPHPALERLLSESYGVLSYQEDVMLVAQEMAGFGTREANLLRKALGRSDTAERLQVLAGQFDAGCYANGIAKPVIDWTWEMISSFAGYSFAKAHSASFAMVSMQCAWLKAHHPAAFLARVIANEGGFYSTSAYVEEARRLGVAIHGPCVLRSRWGTRREGRLGMRLGFHLISGLTRAGADAIERARAERPFAGIGDLLHRTGCTGHDLLALAEAGALDGLTPRWSEAQRAWAVAAIVAAPPRPARASSAGQHALDFADAPGPDPQPPPLPPQPVEVRRRWRCDRLGFVPERHPLGLCAIPRRPALRAADLTPRLAGRVVRLVGRGITRKDVQATYLTDGQGRALPAPRFAPMAFVTLEDETGLIETTWFPEAYRRHAVLLERQEPLLVCGTVEVDYGVVSLAVRSASVAEGD